jgi:hypothetical protein
VQVYRPAAGFPPLSTTLRNANPLAEVARVLCLRMGDASMASNNDDLEEQLRRNLRLRRELGAEIAKARDGNARPERASSAQARSVKHDDSTREVPQGPLPKLATAEPRQGAGLRALFWVLIGAVIAGLALGVAFGWIPISWRGRH